MNKLQLTVKFIALVLALTILTSMDNNNTTARSNEPFKVTIHPLQRNESLSPKSEVAIYNPDIPMPKAHQEFLYEKVRQYQLDFDKTLAIIKHESVFEPNAIGATDDYGYFQVNIFNHTWLSEKLGTPNTPLDPFVNIEWGTYFLSYVYDYWEQNGYTGEELDIAAWSSYNKGINGYLKNGIARNYVKKVEASLESIQNIQGMSVGFMLITK